ncbi:hypothetical protein CURTO8I2_100039 [Curtobacterium sp. 8I-2]|nr:hypothetical protein CURTO8I2_100039 [Curtobacterium sp. 8I-2]
MVGRTAAAPRSPSIRRLRHPSPVVHHPSARPPPTASAHAVRFDGTRPEGDISAVSPPRCTSNRPEWFSPNLTFNDMKLYA